MRFFSKLDNILLVPIDKTCEPVTIINHTNFNRIIVQNLRIFSRSHDFKMNAESAKQNAVVIFQQPMPRLIL